MTPEQMNKALWEKMAALQTRKSEPAPEPVKSNLISLTSMIRESNESNWSQAVPPVIPEAVLVRPSLRANEVVRAQGYEDNRTMPAKWSDCKAMRAKYTGKCSATGRTIEAGEWMIYDVEKRAVYHAKSEAFRKYVDFLNQIACAAGRE